MFTLKPIVTATILISSVLIQQSATAYPKTSQTLELDYLQATMQTIYGNITPEMANFIEEKYNLQDPSTEEMLSGGYEVCDAIELANAQGISSQTLLEQEMTNISQVANSLSEEEGISITNEQIIMVYKTAQNYLCPELN